MFAPILKSANIGLVKLVLLIGFPFAINRLFRFGKRHFTDLFLLFLVLALVIIFCQLIAFIHGEDTQFFALLLSVFTGLVPLSWVAVSIQPKEVHLLLERVVAVIAVVGLLQALSVILAGLFPEIHSWTEGLLVQPPTIVGTHRVTGLSSYAGDGLSYSLAISGIAAIYLFLTRTGIYAYLFAVFCCVIMVAMMFAGRTGYLIFTLFLIVYWFLNPRVKTFLRLLEFFSFLCVGAYCVFLFSSDAMQDMVSNTLLPYAFEFAYNFIEGNGLSTSSSDELMSMWMLPQEGLQWLLGDGYFSHPSIEGANYIPSDIGYLRMLFYVGMIGSALYYGALVLVAHYIISKTRPKEAKGFVIGFFFVSFIAEIKFPFLMQSQFLGVVVLLLFAALHDAEIFTRSPKPYSLGRPLCE